MVTDIKRSGVLCAVGGGQFGTLCGIPVLFSKLVPASKLTESIFYIAVIAFLVWYVMSKSTVGFEMKLTGQNERIQALFAIAIPQK